MTVRVSVLAEVLDEDKVTGSFIGRAFCAEEGTMKVNVGRMTLHTFVCIGTIPHVLGMSCPMYMSKHSCSESVREKKEGVCVCVCVTQCSRTTYRVCRHLKTWLTRHGERILHSGSHLSSAFVTSEQYKLAFLTRTEHKTQQHTESTQHTN